MESFLSIKNVSKTYPGVKALQNVEMKVRPGEVHALIGENGAGKSTLIKILAGVQKPDKGAEITVNGNTYSDLTPLQSTKEGISVIFQDFSLFPNLTVMENIVLSDEVINSKKIINTHERIENTKRVLGEIGLEIDCNAVVGTLSVAKQQMIAIARALIMDCNLLIMDEPTSTLSGGEIEHLFTIIENLKSRGISIIFISHKLDELFRISDRFTVLRDGKYVGTYDRDELDQDKLIALMVGRKVEFVKHSGAETCGKPVLEVKNLTKKGNYKDISFVLHEGEVLSFTGLVGSGRTEIMTTIFGITEADSGEIYIDGKRVKIRNTRQAKRHGIAYVPEDRLRLGIIGSKSLVQNTSITVFDQVKSKAGLLKREKEEQIYLEQQDALNINPKIPKMLAGNLSGGNQQKVVLGKWLARKPRILIVDEPTNGIDVGAKNEIHAILQRLANSGVAVLVVSSELPEVFAVSDRIIVMRGGRIVAEMPNEVTQEEIMSKALLGDPQDYRYQPRERRENV